MNTTHIVCIERIGTFSEDISSIVVPLQSSDTLISPLRLQNKSTMSKEENWWTKYHVDI